MADDKIHLNADGPKAEEAARQFHARPRLANPLLDIALEYANRGWLVFPLRFGTKISHKSAQYSNGRAGAQLPTPLKLSATFDTGLTPISDSHAGPNPVSSFLRSIPLQAAINMMEPLTLLSWSPSVDRYRRH
jgi:hypothetical protein